MRILFGLLLGGMLASCSSDKATDAVNVQNLNQQFIGAWNSKNASQLDSLLADDVQFAQGETHYKGKAEVADKWVRATIGTIANLKTYTASSSADTQIAYDAGTYTAEVLPEQPGGPAGVGEGNYMLVWKKDAGNKWKLSYAQLEGLPVQVK